MRNELMEKLKKLFGKNVKVTTKENKTFVGIFDNYLSKENDEEQEDDEIVVGTICIEINDIKTIEEKNQMTKNVIMSKISELYKKNVIVTTKEGKTFIGPLNEMFKEENEIMVNYTCIKINNIETIEAA